MRPLATSTVATCFPLSNCDISDDGDDAAVYIYHRACVCVSVRAVGRRGPRAPVHDDDAEVYIIVRVSVCLCV